MPNRHWSTLTQILFIGLLLLSCRAQPPQRLETAAATEASTAAVAPATATRLVPTFLPTTLPTATASPSTATPTNPSPTAVLAAPQSVFLVAWDGLGQEQLDDLVTSGDLPTFAALAQQGAQAEYVRSTDPSLTEVAFNTLASGVYPDRTGIVSNSFHNPNDNFYWYRTGFDEPLDAAEPVWVTASRQGVQTATVFFPAGSLDLPGQAADLSVDFGVRDAYSRQVHLELRPAAAWKDAPTSYSPPLEASDSIPEVARWYLLAIDTSDDEQANYDQAILSLERKVKPESLRLKVGEWGEQVLRPALQSGAKFLLQSLDAEQATLYHTTVYHNQAAPRALLEALNARFGFFRASSDSYALQHGWITPADNLRLAERAALWRAEVAAWVYTTYHPGLTLAYLEVFDAAGHSCYLTDPEQLAVYRQAARAGDQALTTLLQAVDLSETAFLMVSDHGMAPVYTSVYVNTLLERAGLLILDERNYVVVPKTRAFAVASGGAAHVYINLRGRERAGIVTAEEYLAVQRQVLDLFSGLVDPQTGQRVFERVLPHADLASLGLEHANAGDVFAQAAPGYALDGWRGNDELFARAPYAGQHGYDSQLPEMHALFIAAGAGIPPGTGLPPMLLVDIAPTVAAFLGIQPAPELDGQAIQGFAYP